VIERHITFDVLADRTDAFERFFVDRYLPALTASPGFIRAELLRELEAPTRYQMVLRFASAEDAVTWRTSAEHEALQPDLVALHSGMTIQPYAVVA
jgi:heme-degrading monooxygenase HmoA